MTFGAYPRGAVGIALALAFTAQPALAAPAVSPPVVLPKDPKTAANICATVYSVRDLIQNNSLSATSIGDGAWHYYEYKRTGPASLTMNDIITLSYQVPENSEELRNNNAQFIAACQKRWPKSARSYPVKLPAKSWDRAMLCLSLAKNMDGFTTVEGVIDPDKMGAKVNAVKAWSLKITNDAALDAHGLTTDAKLIAAMEKAYVSAVTLGNLNSVLDACTKVK